jgi:hypothetical protein
MYFEKKPKFNIEVKDIDQLAVWRHILGINVDVGKVFATTLRIDPTPDCRIKEYNGNLVYYDKPGRYLHGHSCFKAWMTINNVDFPTALRQIAEKVPINSVKLICTPKPTFSSKIVPYVKTWSKNGLNWWKEYNITNLENIYEIEGYELNGTACMFTRLSFAYLYNRNIQGELLPEESWKWKIYQPKSVINGKILKSNWLSNVTKNLTWYKPNSDILFFCKSAKCQLVLESIYGNKYSWIHPQSEVIGVNYPHFEVLAQHNLTIVLLDNDSTGRVMSTKFCELLNSKNINTKQIFTKDYKDVSDMVKAIGVKATKDYLDEVISSAVVNSTIPT